MSGATLRPRDHAAASGLWAAERRLLWLVALRSWRSQALWGLVGAAVVLAVLVATRQAGQGHWLAAVFAVVVGAVLWCNFVVALQRLNLPRTAHLVPGHLLALRRLLLAGWLAATGLCAGLIVASQGLPSSGGLPVWAPVLGPGLVLLAWTMRWPWLWLLLFLASVLVGRTGAGWLTEAVRGLSATLSAQPVTGTLALLALGVVGLWPVLPQAGNFLHSGAPARPAPQWWQRWAALGRRGVTAVYRGWLQRLVSRPSAVMARWLLVLGPAAHWSTQALVAVVAALLALAVVAVLAGFGIRVADLPPERFVGATVGLMAFALSPLLERRAALQRTRREQALLALAPGVPRGAAWRRALGAWLLLQLWLAWAVAAAVGLWLSWGEQGPHAVSLAVAFGLLPFTTWTLWDPRRVNTLSGLATAWRVLLMVAVAMGLAYLLREGRVGVAPVLVGSLALTSLLAVWGWRQLGRA